jgi:hypothetical protein
MFLSSHAAGFIPLSASIVQCEICAVWLWGHTELYCVLLCRVLFLFRNIR